MSVVEKVRLSFYITHESVDVMRMYLTAPDTTVNTDSLIRVTPPLLATPDFGTGTSDADRTTLDDDAATALYTAPSPRAGSFHGGFPGSTLAMYEGLEAGGAWTLETRLPFAFSSSGTLHAASLFLTVDGVETRYDATGLSATIPGSTTPGVTVTFDVPEDDPGGSVWVSGGGGAGPGGDFTIELTPLIRPLEDLDPDTFWVPTQFSDVGVHHILNGFKTAEVTLDMTDPAVEQLQPWEFALRVLYKDRLEPVFHGPCNIVDDWETGKCYLSAQDPSFRMLHHYLRRGDEALNDVPAQDKGTIAMDPTGIQLVVDAAQNITSQDLRNDPSLGVWVYDFGDKFATLRPTLLAIIERGQECWQVINNISRHLLGPDFDMETSYDDLSNYVRLATYDDLGRDLTETIIWVYGPALTDVKRTPGRATTHAHVLSRDAKFRRTGGSVAGSNKVGPTVDWIPTDLEFSDGNDGALQELANNRVAAYGFCPRFIDIKSRPDAVLPDNYGHPDFVAPVGTTESTFYIGDRITVQASRGFRSMDGPARITEVHLTQEGPRGPARTRVKLVPTIGELGEDEES